MILTLITCNDCISKSSENELSIPINLIKHYVLVALEQYNKLNLLLCIEKKN
jgi:hypothetical protein